MIQPCCAPIPRPSHPPPPERLTPELQLVLLVGPCKDLPELLGENTLPEPGLGVPGGLCVRLGDGGSVGSGELPEPV